jgi:hypothetical protein
MDKNLELKRQCVALIVRIAARGASSLDPDDVDVTLEELAHILNEWLHRDLNQLHLELASFSPTSDGLTAYDIVGFAIRSIWN